MNSRFYLIILFLGKSQLENAHFATRLGIFCSSTGTPTGSSQVRRSLRNKSPPSLWPTVWYSNMCVCELGFIFYLLFNCVPVLHRIKNEIEGSREQIQGPHRSLPLPKEGESDGTSDVPAHERHPFALRAEPPDQPLEYDWFDYSIELYISL